MNLNDPESTFRALWVTSGIGFMMAACILSGYYVGSYLDSKFDTAPWLMLVFLLLGIAVGFTEIYNITKKLTKVPNSKGGK